MAGGVPRAGREKFAFSIAEVTDALALEVMSAGAAKLGRMDGRCVAASHLILCRASGNACRYSATRGLTLIFAARGLDAVALVLRSASPACASGH